MFRVYWERDGKREDSVFNSFAAAKYVAFSMVFRMGCDWACVTSEETGEILREYKDYMRG